MKTVTLPPVRVTPECRNDVEGLLLKGETLSAFILAAVERQIEARQIEQTQRTMRRKIQNLASASH
jgi:hypothetical protein